LVLAEHIAAAENTGPEILREIHLRPDAMPVTDADRPDPRRPNPQAGDIDADIGRQTTAFEKRGKAEPVVVGEDAAILGIEYKFELAGIEIGGACHAAEGKDRYIELDPLQRIIDAERSEPERPNVGIERREPTRCCNGSLPHADGDGIEPLLREKIERSLYEEKSQEADKPDRRSNG
jgi:hypothetical protein